MNERALATTQDTENERRKHDTPGRSSASAALRCSDAPMMSGIVMRKASSGEVSDDAQQRVGAASASSGQALPADLRSRFEGSLGTDLSGVRVHTSGESQQAAESVGARAYTMGNDIHFAGGEYDPSSSSGQHLIAHEVAHTVQQRGGTPQRQNKLSVSTAGDSHEVEADRAADAMVTGAPISVGSGASVISRKEAPAADDKAADAKEPEKPKYPSWKDTTVSKDFGGPLGGSVKFDYSETKPTATVEVKKSVKATFFEGKYHQPVQLGPGVVGLVAGSVSLEGSAAAKGAAEGYWFKPEGKDEMACVWAVSANGEVGVEAKGALQLSVGLGVAKVLSLTGGMKAGLTASATAALAIVGSTTKFGDGSETGVMMLSTAFNAGIAADASFVVDIVVPGDMINVYEKTLGTFDIAKAAVTCIDQVSGGTVTHIRPDPTIEWCKMPDPEKRQTRKPTAEEKKKMMATPIEDGESGGRPEGPAEPKDVEMTDEELFEDGQQSAIARLIQAKGKVVPVVTTSFKEALMTLNVPVDGATIPGVYIVPAAFLAEAKKKGIKVVKLKTGSVVDSTFHPVTKDIVAKCEKTSRAVGTHILANYTSVTVQAGELELAEANPAPPPKLDPHGVSDPCAEPIQESTVPKSST